MKKNIIIATLTLFICSFQFAKADSDIKPFDHGYGWSVATKTKERRKRDIEKYKKELAKMGPLTMAQEMQLRSLGAVATCTTGGFLVVLTGVLDTVPLTAGIADGIAAATNTRYFNSKSEDEANYRWILGGLLSGIGDAITDVPELIIDALVTEGETGRPHPKFYGFLKQYNSTVAVANSVLGVDGACQRNARKLNASIQEKISRTLKMLSFSSLAKKDPSKAKLKDKVESRNPATVK